MAVPEFNVKEQWIGNSQLSSYTFDFTIQSLKHLIVIVQDAASKVQFKGLGSDVVFLSSVTFDPAAGGGTINLANPLPNGWVLTALQANDAPSQPSEFKDKFSFTLERFELALDFITTSVQRVAYLAQRSIKLNDVDDQDLIDVTLPSNFPGNANKSLVVNPAGTGFAYGPTTDQIINSEAFADAALVSANAAVAEAANAAASAAAATANAAASVSSAAAAAASAAAAAASAVSFTGFIRSGPFAAIAPNANADLETIDHTLYTQVDYIARVQRGTLVYARIEFSIFYRNSAWEIVMSETRRADLSLTSGVTFTVGVAGAVNAAVANDGGSNAIIDLNKIRWAI